MIVYSGKAVKIRDMPFSAGMSFMGSAFSTCPTPFRILAMPILAQVLALAFFGLASVTPALASGRLALVIGNSDYINTSKLANPRNDAQLMAETLRQSGFDVATLMDADYRAMKKALLDFGRSLREADVEAGLFYYAGHGIQIGGENYLVPIDATITNEDEVDLETINVNSFLQTMNSSTSAINIVILDACRNNPFARSFRSVSRGLAPVQAPKGTLIAYATAPGDVALDGKAQNSPYTLALSQAITQGAGAPIESIFKAARQSVLKESDEQQVPWETSSIIGDFFFHPPLAGTAPPVVSPASPKGVVNIAEAFDIARRAGTADAWRAFIATRGREDAYYAALARDALARLQPSPGLQPKPARSYASCKRVEISGLPANLCVSSVLEPQFGNRYGGSNVIDNNRATAWVEGVDGGGIGQSLMVTFDGLRKIDLVKIVNGYAKNSEIFLKNNRVRQLVVETSGGLRQVVTLMDRDQRQTLDLPDLGEIGWISFEINSVYPGTKYDDTAISELQFE